MKTAEEYFNELHATEEVIGKAEILALMDTYAKAAIEEDRKDCENRATIELFSAPELFPKINKIVYDRPLHFIN